ncbi:MAG TPA: isochorismatase family cysteine hydrolase [Streptosporangiaceae bacterium]
MDRLDPARTALTLVHMGKGVAGKVDTPFSRIFRPRAEQTGIIGVQERLLDGFRSATAKVVYTLVTYEPGFPGVRPNSPLYRAAIDADALQEGTPAVEVMDEVAPGPGEPVVRGTAGSGFEGTPLDTILRWEGVDTLVLAGVATDVAVESTARAACDLGYRTVIVSDACTADSDDAHVSALGRLQKWFGETPTADQVLSALG